MKKAEADCAFVSVACMASPDLLLSLLGWGPCVPNTQAFLQLLRCILLHPLLFICTCCPFLQSPFPPLPLCYSAQFSLVTQSCLTLCGPMDCSTPGLSVYHQLPESIQTHVHWVGEAIQPSHPLSSLLLPPSIFPSIRVFSSESGLRMRWPKDWSFSFNISPSNEHPGLTSFSMHWLDLFAVQGTLKSLLQHHTSKASILQGSAFFMVQLWHSYMTTGKTIA